MKKIVAVLLAGVILTLTGCQGNKAEKKEVNIGYFPNITHAQALVMKSEGLLQNKLKDGTKVNWTSFNAGPAEVTALFAEEIDIGYIGPVPAVSANVNSNGDIKVIAGASQGGAVLVTNVNQKIESVKELAGKTVAIPQLGNTQHLCLLKLLKENGLTVGKAEGQVNVVAVPNSEVSVLMEKNEVAAAFLPEPWGGILEGKGCAKVLLNYDETIDNGNYPVAVVVVRKAFMEEYPDIVAKFMEAHKEATVMLNDEKDKMQSIVNTEISTVTGSEIAEDILKKSFERMVVTTDITEESIMNFAKINQEEGFITSLPEKGIVDRSVLDKAK